MPAFRTRDTHPRSLDVTTDAPQPPPTLAIISPTPRAFTFPSSHNLNDSPYSTPSNSPFESDLRPLACNTPPTQIRSLSPTSSFTSVSPSPSTQHKRRKSSCSSDVERRPKKGDEDYIKRPENAFILFRRKCCEDRQQAQEDAASSVDGVAASPTKKQRQADLSKTISQQWKGLSAEERHYWEQLAKEKKKEHEQMYPNYVYRPQRSKDKEGRSKSRKAKVVRGEFDHDTETEISFVIPGVGSRHHGRSASAPTPPPYQSIQLPSVYLTPSCPTSPSLLPMISRRACHTGHPAETMTNFDYLPTESMPSSFGQVGPYESTFMPPEYFQNMFDMPGQTYMENSNAPSLNPLITYDQSMLLPAHQIFSPSSSVGSGSSGPSSPNSGPFTPTAHTLAQSFAELSSGGEMYQRYQAECSADPKTQAERDEEDRKKYAYRPWESTNDLFSDDFDLSAIPPIELGMPKFDFGDVTGMGVDSLTGCSSGVEVSEMGGYGQEYCQDFAPLEDIQYPVENQSLSGMLAFDEIMAGHGF